MISSKASSFFMAGLHWLAIPRHALHHLVANTFVEMERFAGIFRSRPDVSSLNAALLAALEHARHQSFAQPAPSPGTAYPDPGCMHALLIAGTDNMPRDLVPIPGDDPQTGVRVRSADFAQPGVIAFEGCRSSQRTLPRLLRKWQATGHAKRCGFPGHLAVVQVGWVRWEADKSSTP